MQLNHPPKAHIFQSRRCSNVFFRVSVSGTESPRSFSTRPRTTFVSSLVRNLFWSGNSGMKNQEIAPNNIVIAPSMIYKNKTWDVNLNDRIKVTRENPSPCRDALFPPQKGQEISKDGAETSNQNRYDIEGTKTLHPNEHTSKIRIRITISFRVYNRREEIPFLYFMPSVPEIWDDESACLATHSEKRNVAPSSDHEH